MICPPGKSMSFHKKRKQKKIELVARPVMYKVNVSSRRHNRVSSLMAKIFLLFSSVILLTFSVIVTTRQYVGNPIDCIHTKDVPDDVFDLYCWIHSTYTIPR